MNQTYALSALLTFVLTCFFVVCFFVVCFQRDNREKQLEEIKTEAIQKGFAKWETDGKEIKFVWNEK